MVNLIASFFGMIIRLIYNLVNHNYFISILIFTLFTKLVLLPLYLKQMKSTEEMKKIAPLEKKIQEKYKNDKQKQAEELTKLMSEHKINPLVGCLPLLIQIPIIFAMFAIVRQPLTYILNMSQEQIKTYAVEVYSEVGEENIDEKFIKNNEINIAKEKDLLDMQVCKGFNLGEVPANVFSKDETKKASPVALVIPIFTFILSIISNKLLQRNTADMQAVSEEQEQMQKSMNMMMPLLSASIAYSMPLALGVYWLFGNILQIIQQMVISRIMKKDEEKLALKEGGK